jgi:putative transposase
LVYIDLNMVRAGVVDHPSQWPHGGFNEVQVPRRKNVIIDYERLRTLAGFSDYDSFAAAYLKWVHAALEKIGDKRDSRWTESIAVGSSTFIERIKFAMGAMAKGRSVRQNEGAMVLLETQSAYNEIVRPENRDIDPK